MKRWMAAALGALVVAGLAVLAGGQRPDPGGPEAARAARGEYLVKQVAMCVQCHSPRDDRGELDYERLFQGAPIPVKSPWTRQEWAPQAPSLAGLPGGWSEEQLPNFLQTGKDINGRGPRRPMPPFRMNREDALAVAAYLKSLRVIGGITTRPS
jgi:mono/diheme cytochrome c family protein